MARKTFYIDFYGNRYVVEKYNNGSRLVMGGHFKHTEKTYNTVNGASVALGRFVGGLDSLRITRNIDF